MSTVCSQFQWQRLAALHTNCKHIMDLSDPPLWSLFFYVLLALKSY
jgi:hypothetical protein